MDKPKIQSGIMIPAIQKRVRKKLDAAKRDKYGFPQMAMWDTFFIPEGKINSISAAGCMYRKADPEFNLHCQTVEEKGVKGVRAWRVPVDFRERKEEYLAELEKKLARKKNANGSAASKPKQGKRALQAQLKA